MGLSDTASHCLLWTAYNLLQLLMEVPWSSLMVPHEVNVFAVLIELCFSLWFEYASTSLIIRLLLLLKAVLAVRHVVFFLFVIESIVVFYLIECLLDIKALQHLSVLLPSFFLLESLLHLLLRFILSLQLVPPMFLLTFIKVHCFCHILQFSLDFLLHS